MTIKEMLEQDPLRAWQWMDRITELAPDEHTEAYVGRRRQQVHRLLLMELGYLWLIVEGVVS
jgi:hypothetical protein